MGKKRGALMQRGQSLSLARVALHEPLLSHPLRSWLLPDQSVVWELTEELLSCSFFNELPEGRLIGGTFQYQGKMVPLSESLKGPWYQHLPLVSQTPSPKHRQFYLRCKTQQAYQRAVQEALYLGNHDLYRCVRNGAVYLHSQELSYFLVQRWQEEDSSPIEVFYAQTPQILVQWGCAHPIAEALEFEQAGQTLFFLRAPRHWSWLPNPIWTPIAEDIVLAPLPEIDFEETSLEPSPVIVTLSLEALPPKQSPSLWILSREQYGQIETWLLTLGEEDLQNLTLACLTNATGEPIYCLRERIAGKSAPLLTIEAQGYYRYSPAQFFYLPVGWGLKPRISANQLAQAFCPRAEEVMLLTSSAASAPPRLWRFAEQHFVPLAERITYLLIEQSETLQALTSRVQFPFDSRYEDWLLTPGFWKKQGDRIKTWLRRWQKPEGKKTGEE